MQNKKKKVTQVDVARACGIDQGSISRILNKATRDAFSQGTVEKVFQVAREIGYLHPTLVTTNRRAARRKKIDLKAALNIIIGTSTLYDRGTVEIQEASTAGFLLKNFQTNKSTFPMDRFRLDLKFLSSPLRGMKVKCNVVRFADLKDEFAVAVKISSIDPEDQQRLARFLR